MMRGVLRAFLPWLLLFLLLWASLAEPRPGRWVAGLAAVAAGGLLLRFLGGGGRVRVRPGGLGAFVPYFARQSFLGGLDVARRALSPGLPLTPGLLAHRVSLPPGLPRVFFANALSLLPGTLSARLRDDRLTVHLLVHGPEAEERVRELESRVARVFGVSTGPEGGREGDR